MQELGNAITVLGILVTFVAYFNQHSGVTLAELEPDLTARWNQAGAGSGASWAARPRSLANSKRPSKAWWR